MPAIYLFHRRTLLGGDDLQPAALLTMVLRVVQGFVLLVPIVWHVCTEAAAAGGWFRYLFMDVPAGIDDGTCRHSNVYAVLISTYCLTTAAFCIASVSLEQKLARWSATGAPVETQPRSAHVQSLLEHKLLAFSIVLFLISMTGVSAAAFAPMYNRCSAAAAAAAAAAASDSNRDHDSISSSINHSRSRTIATSDSGSTSVEEDSSSFWGEEEDYSSSSSRGLLSEQEQQQQEEEEEHAALAQQQDQQQRRYHYSHFRFLLWCFAFGILLLMQLAEVFVSWLFLATLCRQQPLANDNRPYGSAAAAASASGNSSRWLATYRNVSCGSLASSGSNSHHHHQLGQHHHHHHHHHHHRVRRQQQQEQDLQYHNHELMEEMWADRCAAACQCLSVASCYLFGGRELFLQTTPADLFLGAATGGANADTPAAFGDIARALADYLETRGVLDVVPSDIVTGFIVLQRLQRLRVYQARREVLLDMERTATHSSLDISEEGLRGQRNRRFSSGQSQQRNLRLSQQQKQKKQPPSLAGSKVSDRNNSSEDLLLPLEEHECEHEQQQKQEREQVGAVTMIAQQQQQQQQQQPPPSMVVRPPLHKQQHQHQHQQHQHQQHGVGGISSSSKSSISTMATATTSSASTTTSVGGSNSSRTTATMPPQQPPLSMYRFDVDGSYERLPRQLLNKNSPSDMSLLEEGARYAKYALAIYTWVLYLYVHPVTGPFRLLSQNCCWCSKTKTKQNSFCRDCDNSNCSASSCCSCCCCFFSSQNRQGRARLPSSSSFSSSSVPELVTQQQHEQQEHSHSTTGGAVLDGDNLCETHKSALLLTAGITEADLVYAQLRSSFTENPYCILLDHAWRSVVVVVRGTFSIEDCVTDVMMDPESLDQLGSDFGFDGAGQHCHGGVLSCVHNVYRDLQRHKLLHRLLSEETGEYAHYTLRLVGHSLGAATCTVLSFMLKKQFPNVRCVNYSPPGCSVTWEMATACQPWCVSFVMDSDLVPRLSMESMERLRDEILELIGRIRVSKTEVARRLLFFRGDDDTTGSRSAAGVPGGGRRDSIGRRRGGCGGCALLGGVCVCCCMNPCRDHALDEEHLEELMETFDEILWQPPPSRAAAAAASSNNNEIRVVSTLSSCEGGGSRDKNINEQKVEDEEDAAVDNNDIMPDSEYKRQWERFRAIQRERRASRGAVRAIQLYPPGKMIHCIKTGERNTCVHGLLKCVTCCTTNAGFEYVPVYIHNSDLNEIVVTPTMGTDHFPNRISDILHSVAADYDIPVS